MVLTRALLLGLALAAGLPAQALAQRDTTRDALDRVSGVLLTRIEDGELDREAMIPSVLVSTRARYEASVGWFETQAIVVLQRVLGPDALRVCDACMVPRTYAGEGRLEQASGAIALEEIVRFDEGRRGAKAPARAAIWLDETAAGVTIKIVDLATARVIWAENVDPRARERFDTARAMKISREYDRRARGDGLTQVFVDAAVFPGQHFSLDWTDQWGETNANFSGVSISLFDPVLGLGAVYYRAFDLGSIGGFRIAPQVGAKVMLSLPQSIIQAISGENVDELDPILTAVGIFRVPFGRSNYGLLLTASTNGRFGVGLSLLNVSFLPVVL